MLDLECERMAAAEELVALTLPWLPLLGTLAMLTESVPEPGHESARALSRDAAVVLRLVDGALAAHGRDHGYPVAAWLGHAYAQAHERSHGVARLTLEELPVSTLVVAAAEALADVVMALHRDRLGVPEGLADALGSLLGLYAAGSASDR